ncbi:MAG: hypothetical protein WAO76_13135 [Georgfuchsia sp.]
MRNQLILIGTLSLMATTAIASPADYVFMPTVEYGEKEIDFKFGTSRQGDDARTSVTSIGMGYGATEWWFTELYVKYKMDDFEHTKYDALEWENKFQLTETGKYPVDVGLVVEVERPRDRTEGWEVKWGPLFQTEFGKWQFNANVLLERLYHADFPSDTLLQYQWQTKYRWEKEFEFGLQGFGEFGQWNDWLPGDQREHKLGPAIFGKIPFGGRQAIKYNAAWLLGASQATNDHTFRLQAEYEF